MRRPASDNYCLRMERPWGILWLEIIDKEFQLLPTTTTTTTTIRRIAAAADHNLPFISKPMGTYVRSSILDRLGRKRMKE
jgi:hypothetical protein